MIAPCTKQEFGEFIRHMRESIGYSRNCLASELCMDPIIIRQFEEGNWYPKDRQHFETVLRNVVKNRLQAKRNHSIVPIRSHWKEEMLTDLVRLWGHRKTIPYIAYHLGISQNLVYVKLKEYGLFQMALRKSG